MHIAHFGLMDVDFDPIVDFPPSFRFVSKIPAEVESKIGKVQENDALAPLGFINVT